MSSTAIDLEHVRAPTSAERWYVLILMCLIYAINIADRYMVSTVLEPIRLDLKLDDAGVAFLTGVPLGIFYVSFGLPLAWLADHVNRRNIVATSLVLWSAFTAVCGLSRTYVQFALARIGVGVGEAGGLPPSSSIISDCFPAERRPMAFSILALGAPIGAYLGADLTGNVAHAFGWRAAFLALGLPGLAVGLLVFLTVREPTRGRLDTGRPPVSCSLLEAAQFLWRQRAAFHVLMGCGVCSLWGWGLVWWTSAFLMRMYGLDVGAAGAIMGPIHLVGGIGATLATAWLLAHASMRSPKRVLNLLAGVIAAATVPSLLAYATNELWIAKLMLWLFVPAIYFFIGPCMGLLQNLAPAEMRSMFIAISLLFGNILNLIVAPEAVGFLSDHFAHGGANDAASLQLALLLLAPTGLWAVAHFLLARRTVRADLERAIRYERGAL